MNLTVKWCLLGLVTVVTSFGIAQAQDEGPAGTVQLGQQSQPAPGAASVQAPAQGQTFVPGDVSPPQGFLQIPPTPGPGQGAASPSYGNYFRLTPFDSVMAPRVNIDSRGGGLYGYNAGYSNIGVMVPYKLDDTAVLFAQGMGLVTYDGRGGATVGTGWRYWDEGFDRIFGLSGWYDFDNGHALPYQQLGLSLESLGRFLDYRVNGYLPVSTADHVLSTNLTNTSVLLGSGIGILRNNTVEQSYSGFDAEMGGPTPILGRYGLNAYIGGYHFMGNGTHGGNFTGVSGRLLSQINEDVSFGVQVTNDSAFGLNTQFQVFVNMPNGKSSRWLRNLRVKDRLVQNVFRQNRVIAKTDSFTSYDTAINPNTHQAFLVANIDPNRTVNGDGSANNPFNSIAAYESLSQAQRQHYDIILVRPRTDATTTNLDTASTLDIFNGQRLLSTTTTQTILAANNGGITLSVPGFTGGADPMLFNSSGGNVITLVGGNTIGQQVSGFEIIGSATGNGIFGNNNVATNISDNNIHGGLNGVLLTNLSGTIAKGTEGQFFNNNIHDNLGNGIQIVNNGSPPFVPNLDVVVQNNIFNANGASGLRMDAMAGATIGGIIGGPNTAATSTTPAVNLSNTFENNTGSGLDLRANGGVLNFSQAAQAATSTTAAVPTFGIFNNTFISNAVDGLHIDTTNNSIAAFTVVNNAFGTASGATSGNGRYGIGLTSDSGTTTLLIGGDKVLNTDGTTFNPGNTFNFNTVSAINLAVTGTAVLNYDINNNTITNGVSATIAPPHDAFTFSFDGTSGTDPFIITNLSDPGVTITSVSWNLAGTPATIAGTTNATGANPVVLQPIGDTLLTSLNGNAVIPGSSPLLISSLNAAATNANSGLAAGSQLLPMGFTNFVPSAVFHATSRFEQAGGSAPLTSASTAGSTLTVTFSNGLTSTQKVALNPAVDALAVAASGEAFGTSTPGFGSGVNGIHVIASGAATMNTANIHNNTITGYGNYGVQVETAGTANASHVVVENNLIQSNGTGVNGAGQNVFSGGGVQFARHDSSTLDVTLDHNTITSNFNTGLSLVADGTATGGLVVNSSSNALSNNAGNGLTSSTSGAAIITFNSNGDVFSGNGGGSGKNVAATGGDNIAIFASGSSVTNMNLINALANSSNGNGLSATTSDTSTLNLVVDTVNSSTFTGSSSFSNNKLNGIVLNSNGDSYMHANVFSTLLNNNVQSGIAFNRSAASLVRSSIVNSNLNNNGTNGLSFHGLGSDPQDPNQPQSGTPNIINLVGDSLNFNGNFTTNSGQGARLDLFGDSELVLNANNTTFDNNAENGIRVELTPGAQFGYQLGNQRSVLDNVEINNNKLNGILITSDVEVSAPGNGFLPFNAPSVTFLQISSNTGSTSISHNGANGILMQYPGGTHDVLVTGDLNPSTNFGTFIQGNTLNGISSVAGVESNPALAPGSGVTLSVDQVLIGGPNAADANGQNGIDFEVQSQFTVNNAANGPFTWAFNGAGFGTLNVNNSVIQNNGADGIALIGNNLDAAATADQRFQNGSGDPAGRLAANISNSMIIGNAKNGVEINLTGQLGWNGNEFGNPRSAATNNNFVLTNNVISSNGLYGVFYQQNTAVNVRSPGSENANFETFRFVDPQPTNPPGPFNPVNFGNQSLGFPYNDTNPNTIGLIDGFEQSNWMWLGTALNSNLVMTGNQVQFNGTQAQIPGNGNPILPGGDGVFIRVSTNSYLSADIRNNTLSGNVQNDFHVESFLAYNPVTNVAPQPTGSVARAAPDTDTIVLDDTAQMDLRFTGNTGNTVNIVNPLVNFGVQVGGGTPLDPRTSPNGAVYGPDPLKGPSFQFPSPRIVQLFQVDDGNNLNSNNNFTQNGVTQDLINGPTGFFTGDWHLRQTADPNFPNSNFPRNFFLSPGNPFSD